MQPSKKPKNTIFHAFDYFKESNFKNVLECLQNPGQIMDEKTIASLINLTKYYAKSSSEPKEYLIKLRETFENEAVTMNTCDLYNLAVLYFYFADYTNSIDVIKAIFYKCDDDYLLMKTAFLAQEIFIYQRREKPFDLICGFLGDIENRLYDRIKTLISAKNTPAAGGPQQHGKASKKSQEDNYNPCLILGSYLSQNGSRPEFNALQEYHLLLKLCKARMHLQLGKEKEAKEIMRNTESTLKIIKQDKSLFCPNLAKAIHSQYVAMLTHIKAQFELNSGQGGLKKVGKLLSSQTVQTEGQGSHPSSVTREKMSSSLSHPFYHYNNLGVLHLHIQKYSLALYYFNKALSFLSSSQVQVLPMGNPCEYISNHAVSHLRYSLFYNMALAYYGLTNYILAYAMFKRAAPILHTTPKRVCQTYSNTRENDLFQRLHSYHPSTNTRNNSGNKENLGENIFARMQLGGKTAPQLIHTLIDASENPQIREMTLNRAKECLRNGLTALLMKKQYDLHYEEIGRNLAHPEETKAESTETKADIQQKERESKFIGECYILQMYISSVEEDPQSVIGYLEQMQPFMESLTPIQKYTVRIYETEALCMLDNYSQALEVNKTLYINSPLDHLLHFQSRLFIAETHQLSCKLGLELNHISIMLLSGALTDAKKNLDELISANQGEEGGKVGAMETQHPFLLFLTLYYHLRTGNEEIAVELLKRRRILPYETTKLFKLVNQLILIQNSYYCNMLSTKMYNKSETIVKRVNIKKGAIEEEACKISVFVDQVETVKSSLILECRKTKINLQCILDKYEEFRNFSGIKKGVKDIVDKDYEKFKGWLEISQSINPHVPLSYGQRKIIREYAKEAGIRSGKYLEELGAEKKIVCTENKKGLLSLMVSLSKSLSVLMDKYNEMLLQNYTNSRAKKNVIGEEEKEEISNSSGSNNSSSSPNSKYSELRREERNKENPIKPLPQRQRLNLRIKLKICKINTQEDIIMDRIIPLSGMRIGNSRELPELLAPTQLEISSSSGMYNITCEAKNSGITLFRLPSSPARRYKLCVGNYIVLSTQRNIGLEVRECMNIVIAKFPATHGATQGESPELSDFLDPQWKERIETVSGSPYISLADPLNPLLVYSLYPTMDKREWIFGRGLQGVHVDYHIQGKDISWVHCVVGYHDLLGWYIREPYHKPSTYGTYIALITYDRISLSSFHFELSGTMHFIAGPYLFIVYIYIYILYSSQKRIYLLRLILNLSLLIQVEYRIISLFINLSISIVYQYIRIYILNIHILLNIINIVYKYMVEGPDLVNECINLERRIIHEYDVLSENLKLERENIVLIDDKSAFETNLETLNIISNMTPELDSCLAHLIQHLEEFLRVLEGISKYNDLIRTNTLKISTLFDSMNELNKYLINTTFLQFKEIEDKLKDKRVQKEFVDTEEYLLTHGIQNSQSQNELF